VNSKKDNLGRKILDLIQENEIVFRDNEEVVDIDIQRIKPNPQQPRVVFNEKSLKELATSIKQYGVIQPIIVKQVQQDYYLIAGERRLRASKLANRKTIPALIRNYGSKYYAEMAILENVQRESLTSIEEAIAYKKLLEKTTLTHDQLGKKIGKSRSYITNIIGLLNLPDSVIKKVNEGEISTGHAKILSKLSRPDIVEKFAQEITSNNLNVRETETLIQNYKRQYYTNTKTVNKEIHYLSNKIKDYLNLNDDEIVVKRNSITISLKDIKRLKELNKDI